MDIKSESLNKRLGKEKYFFRHTFSIIQRSFSDKEDEEAVMKGNKDRNRS